MGGVAVSPTLCCDDVVGKCGGNKKTQCCDRVFCQAGNCLAIAGWVLKSGATTTLPAVGKPANVTACCDNRKMFCSANRNATGLDASEDNPANLALKQFKCDTDYSLKANSFTTPAKAEKVISSVSTTSVSLLVVLGAALAAMF